MAKLAVQIVKIVHAIGYGGTQCARESVSPYIALSGTVLNYIGKWSQLHAPRLDYVVFDYCAASAVEHRTY